jgi:hypothetical protein
VLEHERAAAPMQLSADPLDRNIIAAPSCLLEPLFVGTGIAGGGPSI